MDNFILFYSEARDSFKNLYFDCSILKSDIIWALKKDDSHLGHTFFNDL